MMSCDIQEKIAIRISQIRKVVMNTGGLWMTLESSELRSHIHFVSARVTTSKMFIPLLRSLMFFIRKSVYCLAHSSDSIIYSFCVMTDVIVS